MLVRIGEDFQDLVHQLSLLERLQGVELVGDVFGCFIQQYIPDGVLLLLLPVGLHDAILVQPVRPQFGFPGRPLLAALPNELVQHASPLQLLLQELPVEPTVLRAYHFDLLGPDLLRVPQHPDALLEVLGWEGLQQQTREQRFPVLFVRKLAECVGKIRPALVHYL